MDLLLRPIIVRFVAQCASDIRSLTWFPKSNVPFWLTSYTRCRIPIDCLEYGLIGPPDVLRSDSGTTSSQAAFHQKDILKSVGDVFQRPAESITQRAKAGLTGSCLC
jgi:hypothetical protein